MAACRYGNEAAAAEREPRGEEDRRGSRNDVLRRRPIAKCKFCGQGVRSGPVFHTGCWEQAVNKLASEICDEYCKFPFEMDYEALVDKCEQCPMVRLKELGGKV